MFIEIKTLFFKQNVNDFYFLNEKVNYIFLSNRDMVLLSTYYKETLLRNNRKEFIIEKQSPLHENFRLTYHDWVRSLN